MLPDDRHRRLAALILNLVLWGVGTPAQGAFLLNFDKYATGTVNNSLAEFNCGNFHGYGNDGDCNWNKASGGLAFDNGTPFRQEVISDSGQYYWHVLVGNPTDTFRQDVYVRMGTKWNYMQNGGSGEITKTGAGNAAAFSDSGGFTSGLNGKQQASATSQVQCETYMGNGCDPLGRQAGIITHDATWTGNASANPTRVVMRQINEDAANGMSMEFKKDALNTKPLITQTITTADMSSQFQADMRQITYPDMNTPLAMGSTYGASGVFVSKLSFTDPALQPFDIATDTQAGHSTVTAGRYTYTAGQGWRADGVTPTYYTTYYQGKAGVNAGDFQPVPLYNSGTYTYFDGGLDPFAQRYGNFLNPTQNPCGGNSFC